MRIRFSKRALDQIDDALGYVRERSPQGAAAIERRITELTTLILQYPRSGSRTRIPGVRRILLTPYPYLIDYFVGDDEIVVQRFRHAARHPV